MTVNVHEAKTHLSHLLERVAAGEPILSPSVTRRLIAHLGDTGANARQRRARALLARLNGREREVAMAVGRGRSNSEISAELFMSVATVKQHDALAGVRPGMGAPGGALLGTWYPQTRKPLAEVGPIGLCRTAGALRRARCLAAAYPRLPVRTRSGEESPG